MELKENTIVRHFKGNLYLFLGIAKHTETGEELVLYKALYGKGLLYARPKSMFFEKVPENKINPTGQAYRFQPFEPLNVTLL